MTRFQSRRGRRLWNPTDIPIIDIGDLGERGDPSGRVAKEIVDACRQYGFFYVVGHGVESDLQRDLERASRRVFALPIEDRMAIRMELGGRAWRGYFPVGAEQTSGQPDQKEGIYFGSELYADHPAVVRQLPMHGQNLFPAQVPELEPLVLQYIAVMTSLGHRLLEAIGAGLGLGREEAGIFSCDDPLTLFRIFNYPRLPERSRAEGCHVEGRGVEGRGWSVGEHTDYGFLTILRQDDVGGLQLKTRGKWVDAPPVEESFVCNIGDMLDRVTRGHLRSTPHRVLNTSDRDRLSWPFFFDPAYDARVAPISSLSPADDDQQRRWDGESVHDFDGTYGEYLLRKVSRVFPMLSHDQLDG